MPSPLLAAFGPPLTTAPAREVKVPLWVTRDLQEDRQRFLVSDGLRAMSVGVLEVCLLRANSGRAHQRSLDR